MWFSLFSLVLILCIAFFQALQGLFSAVIMCVLTILSAALAFGTYEYLHYGPLIGQIPEYGEAVALVGIFLVTLIVLRTLFDNLIKGNMQFPVWVDRIGGGVLGLVSSIIIVGMVQLGFQLLPFDSDFLGFNRFVAVSADRNAELDDKDFATKGPDVIRWKRKNLALSPDERVADLVSLLSDGALSGETRFGEVHPDFAAGIQNSRSGVQRESRHALGAADAIEADRKGYWVLPPNRLMRLELETDKAGNDRAVEKGSEERSGYELRVYHVYLTEAAGDTDSKVRFRSPQVRIVGRDRSGGPPSEYTLKGIAKDANATQFIALYRVPLLGKDDWSNVVRTARGSKTPFDFVFEVPKGFQAAFIEFKRTARADVSALRAKPEKELVEPAPAPKPKPKETKNANVGDAPSPDSPDANAQPLGESKDRISGVWLQSKPVYSERLPLKLVGQPGGLEIENGKLTGGHCALAVMPENTARTDAERLPFDVPEGHRLLFVPVKELDPQSYLGSAAGFAQRALPTVSLKLADGKQIKPVGKYAFAKMGGQWWFEITYLNEIARQADRDIPIFEKIKHANLVEPNSVYVYLFLIPSGGQAVSLERAKREPIDLRSFNLVAP